MLKNNKEQFVYQFIQYAAVKISCQSLNIYICLKNMYNKFNLWP